jgi:NADH-quinone oxidoreductase subunit N
MNFTQRINGLVEDTVQHSLGCFGPELILCAAIVFLLLFRLVGLDRLVPTKFVALFSVLAAFIVACLQFMQLKSGSDVVSQTFFTGLLVYDQFTVFFRVFLLLFLVLVITLTVLSGIPDSEDGPDFYSLLIGSTIGMMLMVSANHLLILFLGIEMTSVPSYAMVGFLKGRKLSSEAALKYVIYGAGAAGVMLYGISLIAGLLGTGDLSQLGINLQLLIADQVQGDSIGISNPTVRMVVFGILLVMVGLAFKLSIVPFHFWCPDAFEGASAEVAGFLSVASKAGGFALLIRFCLAFSGGDPGAMSGVYLSLGIGLGVIAAVSTTFGNLAAYAQTNMKRLLAYSTIAHAGYMLMAVAALLVILNAPASAGLSSTDIQQQASQCIEGLMYYLAVYLLINLGAFANVAFISKQKISEEKEY